MKSFEIQSNEEKSKFKREKNETFNQINIEKTGNKKSVADAWKRMMVNKLVWQENSSV